MLAAAESEQLARDEELARQLQQQEFHSFVPHFRHSHSDPADIEAPLLDNQDGVAAHNEEEPLEPQGVGQAQEQIRRNVIDSVRDADTESPRILLARVTIGLLEMIATATILAIGWSQHCGQPLKFWVLAYSARHLATLPMRVFIYRQRRTENREILEKSLQLLRWINIVSFLWFLVGQSFLFTGKGCQDSAPVVWYYCLVIIVLVYVSLALPFLIVLAICICLPCVLIVFRFFAEPEGADNKVIRNLPTRKIQREDIETADGDDEPDENERKACAICIQDYEADDEVRILPCGHEFHASCVDKWLPVKKICPLCRHDVTKPKRSARTMSTSPLNDSRPGSEPLLAHGSEELPSSEPPADDGERLERA